MDQPTLSEKKTLALLFKDMDMELNAIKFYLESLEELNYAENKETINHLVLDSIGHIEILAKQLLLFGPTTKTKISEDARHMAMKEETTMKDIYVYLENKTDKKDLIKALDALSKMEESHERMVKDLK
jgi:rubrerythrin